MGFDTSLFAQWLGVPEVRFTALLTGGGGGSAGSVGLASAAIVSGMAECVVSVMTLQQAASRFGASFAPRGNAGRGVLGAAVTRGQLHPAVGPDGPGQMFAVLAQRHMHLYGTTREHFCEVAISTRANAIRRPTSLMQEPLTREQYFGAAHDLRPVVPLRLLPGVRRRGRGGHDVGGAGARSAAPAGVRRRVRERRARSLGAGDHVDGHARRVLRVVGSSPGRAAALRDGRRDGRRRRRRVALRPLQPDGDHAARGLRLLRDRRGRTVRRRRQHPLARRDRCRSTRTAATSRRRTSSA